MRRSDDTAAVLLCGGTSERLGFPKEMLRVDGEALAVKQVRRLQGLFAKVFVSSNRPAYLRHLLDVPVLKDEVPDCGPLAGVLTGLKRAGARRVFFLACDLPAVPDEVIRTLLARATESEAQSVVAQTGGQLLCAVHSADLAPALERFLRAGGRRAREFLCTTRLEAVEFPGVEPWRFRDVDEPADLWLLGKVFRDVEPLPVRRVPMGRLGGRPAASDLVVEEWPVAIEVNGVKLATNLCVPNALRELAVGFASYLGLVERPETIGALYVDYAARRVKLALDVEDGRIKNAVQLLITSTCGASIYGRDAGQPPPMAECGFRVRARHVLECLAALRQMAPIFERTGATHQAAFSDGERIRDFFEDVGRHNAVDKVIGRGILDGRAMERGVLLATGRITSEMVVKAIGARIPVAASRSAVTSNALRIAGAAGLTLIGFARGGRLNVYTGRYRVTEE